MSGFRRGMIANAAVPYGRRVAYLQNVYDTAQYIDTGIWVDQTEDLYISARTATLTASRGLICSSHYSSPAWACVSLEWYNNTVPRAYLCTNNTTTDITSTNLSTGIVYDLYLDYSPSRGSAILSTGGQTYSKTLPYGDNNEYGNLRLFLDHRENNSTLLNPIQIYSLQIKQAGVLVRDFIPVLDKDGVPCMYDKVSRGLFYNQGVGQFIYGE